MTFKTPGKVISPEYNIGTISTIDPPACIIPVHSWGPMWLNLNTARVFRFNGYKYVLVDPFRGCTVSYAQLLFPVMYIAGSPMTMPLIDGFF
jgi:hypothetical protein